MLVVVLALLIPILAIVLHSPVGHSLADRSRHVDNKALDDLNRRVMALEEHIDEIGRVVRELHEETHFLQSLLQERGKPPPIPPPNR